jgi:hypothetical protein
MERSWIFREALISKWGGEIFLRACLKKAVGNEKRLTLRREDGSAFYAQRYLSDENR